MVSRGGKQRVAGGVLCALFILSCSPGIAHATFAGSNGRIVYTSYGSGEVYTANPDGSGVKHIASLGYNATPAWSQDGSLLDWRCYTGGGTNYQACVMNADGSDQHVVPPERSGVVFTVGWMPADRVLYSLNPPDDSTENWITNVNGSSPKFIGYGGGFSVASPDGTKFLTYGSGTVSTTLEYESYSNGKLQSGAQILSLDAHANISCPSWAPDSHKIVFTETGGGSGLWTVNDDGSGLTQVLTNDSNATCATFSPDGKELLYTRTVWTQVPGGFSPHDSVRTYNLATHDIQLVADNMTNADWQPINGSHFNTGSSASTAAGGSTSTAKTSTSPSAAHQTTNSKTTGGRAPQPRKNSGSAARHAKNFSGSKASPTGEVKGAAIIKQPVSAALALVKSTPELRAHPWAGVLLVGTVALGTGGYWSWRRYYRKVTPQIPHES